MSHKHLHLRKRHHFAWTPPDSKGHILLWLGEILEPHFRAFESGAGLGRYNGCIPTIPNARESEPYTLYCHQYYTVHTIKYHTVNIHLRHSAGSNLHINPTWKWIHEIWPLKGESLTFFKKNSSKMTQNNGLLSNFIPKIGTTSLSLTPYCVVKCFFKKKTRFTLGCPELGLKHPLPLLPYKFWTIKQSTFWSILMIEGCDFQSWYCTVSYVHNNTVYPSNVYIFIQISTFFSILSSRSPWLSS